MAAEVVAEAEVVAAAAGASWLLKQFPASLKGACRNRC